MLKTKLRGEISFLMRCGALIAAEVLEANRSAFSASFVKGR